MSFRRFPSVSAIALIASSVLASPPQSEVRENQSQESSVSALKKDGPSSAAVVSTPVRAAAPHQTSGVALESEQLGKLVDAWHKSVLRGDQSSIERSYDSLHSFLSADLDRSREGLRIQAELAAYSTSGQQSQVPACADEAEQRGQFEDQLGLFRSKELIAEAIDRNSSFSNRYRLLGDYADLLRKELGMNRIVLASKEKTAPPR